MASMLQQLENETVLLMYLADELPAEDRAEVDQLLATDVNLRAQLLLLGEAHAKMESSLRQLDASTRLPVSPAVGVRQTMRLVRQRLLMGAENEVVETSPQKSLAFPWWCYPVAASVALLLAYVAWWGMRVDAPSPQIVNVPTMSIEDVHNQQLAAELEGSFRGIEDTPLNDAEKELVALTDTQTDETFDWANTP